VGGGGAGPGKAWGGTPTTKIANSVLTWPGKVWWGLGRAGFGKARKFLPTGGTYGTGIKETSGISTSG